MVVDTSVGNPRALGERKTIRLEDIAAMVISGRAATVWEMADMIASRHGKRALDFLDRLAGVLRVDLVEPAAQRERLSRVDLDVRGLPLEAAAGLVDEHARVGEHEPLALRTPREQERAHRHGGAEADGLHVGRDVLHRVVDGEPGVDLAAR